MIWNSIQSLWLRITLPVVAIQDDYHRETARFLAGFSLLVWLGAAMLMTFLTVEAANITPAASLIVLSLLFAFLAPYCLARYGKLKTAIVVHVLVGSIGIFAATVFRPAPNNLFILFYLAPMFVYAAIYLTTRIFVILISVILTLMVVTLPLFLTNSLESILRYPMLFNLLSASSGLAIIAYWRHREAAQRRKVEESETRYRIISEMNSDYMFFVRQDASGARKLEWVTESVEQFSGYSITEVLAQTDANIYKDDLPLVLANRSKTMAGEPSTGEYRFIRKDGEIRWVQVLSRPAWDNAHTQVIGYYGAVRDITDRKQAEQEHFQLALRREQFNIVEQFTAAMSHDFRNRLATIESSRHILGKLAERSSDSSLPAKMESRMADIQQSIQSMIEQIDNLSVVTSVSNPRMVELRLSSLLDLIAEKMDAKAKAANINLHFEPLIDDQTLCADHEQLENALKHIISNAIHYSEAGETVCVRARRVQKLIAIEVEDKGIGIPPDTLQHIFDPFYKIGDARTITQGGVGLGLTIVKLIVEAHSGRIEVESTVGRGSLFRLLLPVLDAT
jgi:PAS domain S-box-containing protein